MKNINEALLQRARTSIFIAHRLRTVVECGTSVSIYHVDLSLTYYLDLIIVLKEGQVVEQGTHVELLKQGGLYYSMWLQQAMAETVSESKRVAEESNETID